MRWNNCQRVAYCHASGSQSAPGWVPGNITRYTASHAMSEGVACQSWFVRIGDFKTRQKKQHRQLKCRGSDEVGDAKRYMTVWKMNLSLSEDDGEGNFVEFLRLVQNELQ